MIFNQHIVGTLTNPIKGALRKINLNSYRLTRAGEEVFKAICLNNKRSREFALSHFRKLKENYSEINVRAYDILEITDQIVRHSPNDLL